MPNHEEGDSSQHIPTTREDLWHIALQISTVYIVAFLWFLGALSGLWDDFLHHTKVGEYIVLIADMRSGPRVLQKDNGLALVALCATTHTILVFAGIALSARVNLCRSETRARIRALIEVLFMFFLATYRGLKYCFENKVGVVYTFASVFWNDSGAKPFALTGATTMSVWLAASFTVPQFDPAGFRLGCKSGWRGLVPLTYSQYAPHMVLVYAICFAFFRFVVNLFAGLREPVRAILPGVVNLYAGPAVEKRTFDDKTLQTICEFVSFTHASSIALGVVLCAVVNRWLAQRLPANPSHTPTTKIIRNSLQDLVVLAFLIAAFGSLVMVAVARDPLDFQRMELSAKVRHLLGCSIFELVICISYSSFFGLGVLIEQVWHGSSTNTLYRPPGYVHVLTAALNVPFTMFQQIAWPIFMCTLCFAIWHEVL